MSEASAYLVVTATPNPDGADAMQQYIAQAGELLGAAGAQPVGRFKFAQALTGSDFPALTAVMEFPSAAAITDTFASDAYAELIPLRDQGFIDINIAIADKA